MAQEKHMTEPEFLNEIDAIIESAQGSTTMDNELSTLPGWDSMAIISFIAMADDKLGMSLDIKSLTACKTVEDLARLCRISGAK
jgi:acyl carrier protein